MDASENANAPPQWECDGVFDGGTAGCGELLLDLRLHCQNLPEGFRLCLRTLDPGAPLEIPAWCRLTGHRLAAAEHPHYQLHTVRRQP
ncbi:MAG TPA: hypothetical protein VMN36_13495 [Verrucomicrobiales bacterium]|nr:hypothetical protein [Verrucomicrobiales bacterium]